MPPKNKTAIIFGGSGFIGTHLNAYLNDSGYTTYIIDLSAPPKDSKANYIFGDVRHSINFSPPKDTELVFNLAAIHRTPGHKGQEYYETNVLGAINITDWCTKHRIRCLVFTSSISIYGPSELILDEETTPNPVSEYGKSKFIAEHIHRNWKSQNPDNKLVIVRPAVIFGPNENGNFTRLAKSLKKGFFVYPGRIDTIKSCGYVEDLIRSMDFAIKLDRSYYLYNFTFSEFYSIEEICVTICSTYGFKFPKNVPLNSFTKILKILGPIGNRLEERMLKLLISTKVAPKHLQEDNFHWNYNLTTAISSWKRSSTKEKYLA